MVRIGDHLRRAVHGHSGCLNRECGAALDSARIAFLRTEPAVGLECLRALLRWLLDAGRTGGGQVGPPPCLCDRRDALHGGLALLRFGNQQRLARDSPCGAGPRSGNPLTRSSVHPHRHFRGGARAQQGAEHLGCDRRCRWRVRRPARRNPHPGGRLAMDLLRQRPHRLFGGPGQFLHPCTLPV